MVVTTSKSTADLQNHEAAGTPELHTSTDSVKQHQSIRLLATVRVPDNPGGVFNVNVV